MKLVSVDGASVDLRPLRYEFPGIAGAGHGDWDANWLVVGGEVRLADGRAWSFSEPCLTTWEARALGSWLRGVVTGKVRPTAFDGGDGDGEESLETFTEPNIALSLAARSDDAAVVRVHLSLESRPPWLADGFDIFGFFVSLDVPLHALAAAADEWDRELAAFPVR